MKKPPMMKPKMLKGKFKQPDTKKPGTKGMKGAKGRERRLEKEPM